MNTQSQTTLPGPASRRGNGSGRPARGALNSAIVAVAVGVVMGIGVCATSYAQSPGLLPAQGVLYDEGEPIEGTRSVHFTIYVGAGLTNVWSEMQEVAFERGLFSVYLGVNTPIDTSVFAENSNAYLGVRVDGDDEMQLIRLATVPYAGYADHAGMASQAASAEVAGHAATASHADSADYAALAGDADFAATAGDAATLGGQTAGAIVSEAISAGDARFAPIAHTHAWGDITGIPADLLDGDDDTLGALSCLANHLAVYNGTSWQCLPVSATDTLAGLSCTNGEYPRRQGGAWICAPDTLGGLSCANGQIARFQGGSWICGADNVGGTIMSIVAGTGLNGGGTTGTVNMSLDTTFTDNRYVNVGQSIPANNVAAPGGCANNQVLQRSGTGWACTNLPNINNQWLSANGPNLTGVTPGRPYLVSVYGVIANRGTGNATLGFVRIFSGANTLIQTGQMTINWPDGNAPITFTAVVIPTTNQLSAQLDSGAGTVLYMGAYELPRY